MKGNLQITVINSRVKPAYSIFIKLTISGYSPSAEYQEYREYQTSGGGQSVAEAQLKRSSTHAYLHRSHPPLPSADVLEPRGIPFPGTDTFDRKTQLSQFSDIGSVLRHRAKTMGKFTAFTILDSKGKDILSISWEKFASRAEKVAQVIKDKSGLYRGDRVALVYKDSDNIEFAVALFGCFIAGVVAVPINNPEDYGTLGHILSTTQTHLALTTDDNLKAFQRDLVQRRQAWPRGVEWWKTNEFGSASSKKQDGHTQLQAPDLAYIEFSKAPTGELRGVVVSHLTIMHQMSTLCAMLESSALPGADDGAGEHAFGGSMNAKAYKRSSEVLLTYLDARTGMGMIGSILLSVYMGLISIWVPQAAVIQQGLFAGIITRLRVTYLFADYPGLKTVAYNYQYDPLATRNFSKRHPVDFSSLRLCFIECLAVDPEFHEILTDRWLRPLGVVHARRLIVPLLCLPEHGGMVIAARDWLGGIERLSPAINYPNKTGTDTELAEILLDKETLKSNDVVVLARGAEARRRAGEAGTVRIGAYGYPTADTTLAIVNPETSVIAPENCIGEIWVDSPSLSGGFWALPKQTNNIFRARPEVLKEEESHTEVYNQEFVRTGFLGCIIDGWVFVLGLYEDRLRQKVEWVESSADGLEEDKVEYRYHYTNHLVQSILTKVPKIFDW